MNLCCSLTRLTFVVEALTFTFNFGTMESLVISSADHKELELLKQLAEKMGLKAHLLSEEEKEDLGLLNAMLESKKEDYVDEDEVLKALREK